MGLAACGSPSSDDNNTSTQDGGLHDVGTSDVGGADGGGGDTGGGGEEGEVLPSNIGEDTVLENIVSDPSEPDYYAETNVGVGAHLEIRPGVVIEFSPDTYMNVKGRDNGILDVRGTEEEPVLFTGELKEKGSWRGVSIDNSTASQNRLEWTIIEYGGGAEVGNGLGASNLGIGGFVGASTMSVTDCTFRESGGYGVELESETSFINFERNTFANNTGYALRIPAEQRGKIDQETTFTGQEDEAGVELFGGNASTDQTWQPLKGQATTAVTGNISTNANLEIAGGVTLKFDDNVSLGIKGRDGGTLVASGTADSPIVMTSLGGVIWKGLYFDGSESSINNMAYVTLENAGFSAFEDDQKAALTVGGFVGLTTLTVTDSTFRDSSGAGIYVENESSLNDDADTANTFENNAGVDILFE
jgi:hypothetical protein